MPVRVCVLGSVKESDVWLPADEAEACKREPLCPEQGLPAHVGHCFLAKVPEHCESYSSFKLCLNHPKTRSRAADI